MKTPTTKPTPEHTTADYNPWSETPRRSTAPNPAREDLHLLTDIPAIVLAAWTVDGGGAELIQEIER